WTDAPAQTAPSPAAVTFGQAYDVSSQRAAQTATDSTWLKYPPGSGSTTSYTANGLDQYTSVGAASPTYDGNGNLATDGTFTFCYDSENRLTSILTSGSCASPGTTVATYAYDWRRV